MTELSENAQKILHLAQQNTFLQVDERAIYGGGNPDATDTEGVVDAAVAELRAAGVDLKVSDGPVRRMIAIL